METVKGQKIVIHFVAERCIHSRHCVLDHPDVFVPNVQGEWIHPDAANAEALTALAHNCPSGAIRYERLDGGPEEQAPLVNTVHIRENGPLAVHAQLQIGDGPQEFRATLCRCGHSQRKPYCDGSHAAAGFQATGEPTTAESMPLSSRNGLLLIKPSPNGPLLLTGNVELVSGTGRTINRVNKTALCRCGHSQNKPYCDGSHNQAGFKSD